MELAEAMRTQHACRYYRDDPVPDEVLLRAVELARFAPNGGNRCAVRFVFVRDPALRRQLGEWYLPLWEEVAAAARGGAEAIRGAGGAAKSVQTGFTDTARTMADTDQFARRFAGYPARPFPRRPHRPDASELAFADRYGSRLSAGGLSAGEGGP
jgi:nitroreductase